MCSVGSHTLASGWQKIKWKCLSGRGNALCKCQSVASERGNFCIAVGRDGYSFKLFKGPSKSLVYSELGRSCLGLWHFSPSSPWKLTWRRPVSSVRLTGRLAWSLSGHCDRSRPQRFCIRCGQTASGAEIQQGPREAAMSWKDPAASNCHVLWSLESGACSPRVKVFQKGAGRDY